MRFPAFQLIDRPGSATKAILPGLATILTAFTAAGVDPWTVASWMCTPAELLDAMTPVRWLAREHDPKRALEAAHRSAARLGQ